MTLPYCIRWKTNAFDPKVASVRIRCLNIIEHLKQQNVDIALYSAEEKKPCDIIIFSKAYTTEDIKLANAVKKQGTKVVFDLCDNHFLSEPSVVKRLSEMMRASDFWVSSTNEMARIISANLGDETPILVIGDAVEKSYDLPAKSFISSLKTQWQLKRLRSFLASHHKPSSHGRLLWFGNHSGGQADSGMIHLSKVENIITDIAKSIPLTLTVISNSKKKYTKVVAPWSIPTFYCEWNPHTFFDMLKAHDIAIIPIKVNDFTRVKSNNRIALPLSQGLNVIADGIDSYLEFSEFAYLDNWREGILNYTHNEQIRRQHINAAQTILNNEYSIQAISQQWMRLFKRIMTK